MSAQCTRCGAPASQRCSGCSVPYYCSRQCQKTDWKTHRPQCQQHQLTEVRQKDSVGRYTVAGRDLRPGQLVVREPPLTAGPQLDSLPQCLTCSRLLVGGTPTVSCAACRWPMCSASCAQSPGHRAECQVLAQDSGDRPTASDERNPRYDCILPLRLLLLQSQPRVWEKVTRLENHLDRRRDTAIYRDNQKHVVDYLRQHCHVEASEELLHTLCGILDVNAFALRAQPGCGRRRALFARTSLLNHSCVSNTNLSLDGEAMVVKTAVPLKAGTEITAAYISAFDPTAKRLDYLANGKYFDCACERCRDATELGTFYGSHRCEKCREMMISTRPLDLKANWQCSACNHTQSADEVRQMNSQLAAERDRLSETDVAGMEAFLARHGEFPLHSNNYHVLSVKQTLAQLYGNLSGYQLDEISDERLTLKELYCRQLIAVAQLFEPGLSRLRAMMLMELHHALVTSAQRRQSAGARKPTALLAGLQEAGRCVEQAISILSQEPESTLEGGAMLRLAKETLQGCYEFTQMVKSSIK